MQASITCIPRFNFEMNIELIDILIKLSEAHYDSLCRSVSKQGGFLFGWRNIVDFGGGLITCEFKELDITLKISEDFMSTLSENELKIISSYRKFVLRLIESSEALINYRIEVKK